MFNPFIELISAVIDLYNIVLIVWVVLGLLISLQIVNRSQAFVYQLNYALSRLVEPLLRPIRRYMPDLGMIDISPIVLILLLHFVQRCLFQYFYTYN